jgi:hypothetical protein
MLREALPKMILPVVLSVAAAFATAAPPTPSGAAPEAPAAFGRLLGNDEWRSAWTEIEGGKTIFVARSRLVRKPR